MSVSPHAMSSPGELQAGEVVGVPAAVVAAWGVLVSAGSGFGDARWAMQEAVWADRPREALVPGWVAEELALLQAVERVKAWADAQGLVALARLREAVEREVSDRHYTLASEGHFVGPGQVARETDAATVDEVAIATGLPEGVVQRRLALAVDDDGRYGVLTAALAAGEVTLDRAVRVAETTSVLDPVTVKAISTRLVTRDPVGQPTMATADGQGVPGGVRSHRWFVRELRRQVVLHQTDPTVTRGEELTRRTAYGRLDEDGTGTLVVTGEGLRVTAALDRVESIARRLRQQGDARTLENLRSDVALDLILTGWAPGSGVTGFDVIGLQGECPPAHVTVTVGLSTLLGQDERVADVPGWGAIGAVHARQAAMATGSVWRRLVTDPLTGAGLDLSTRRYRPTPAMADLVAALDGVCRSPGCTVAAGRCDLDHGEDWPCGPTAIANLTAKHGRHHNHKTRRTWRSESTTDGTITWTLLSGVRYLTKRHNHDDPLAAPATEDELSAAEAFDPPPF